jgi:hypothetical protein
MIPRALRRAAATTRCNMSTTTGQVIKCKAAVARGVNDLRIEEIFVDPPKGTFLITTYTHTHTHARTQLERSE